MTSCGRTDILPVVKQTKELLGGILVLEARDRNHAIPLISQHPGVKMGPFEIRPAADFDEMVKERSSDERPSCDDGGPRERMIRIMAGLAGGTHAFQLAWKS